MKGEIAIRIKKLFSKVMLFCFDKAEEKYMRARCALIILNRMKSIFPNTYDIAAQIQGKLQTLVDARGEIKRDLHVLAAGCNEELKRRLQRFPEHAALEREKARKAAEAKAKQEAEDQQKKPP